jgi:acyl carrier protein
VDSNSKSPTFNDVADFVRAWGRIPVKRQIDPETQFERDLGITGDDGSELLEAAQKKFGVDLAPDESGYRKIFGLGPNEYLFNSAGFGPVAGLMTLFTTPSVRAFTVGELFKAIQQAQQPREQKHE